MANGSLPGLKILVSVVRFRPRPPYFHRSSARSTVFLFVRLVKWPALSLDRTRSTRLAQRVLLPKLLSPQPFAWETVKLSSTAAHTARFTNVATKISRRNLVQTAAGLSTPSTIFCTTCPACGGRAVTANWWRQWQDCVPLVFQLNRISFNKP